MDILYGFEIFKIQKELKILQISEKDLISGNLQKISIFWSTEYKVHNINR